MTHNSHFRDESFQAIDCTGTDNQTATKRKYIKRKKQMLRQINWP